MMTRAFSAQPDLANCSTTISNIEGGYGEIVRRLPSGTQFFADRLERCRIAIVAIDVAQQAAQSVESGSVVARHAARRLREPAP